MDRAEAPGLPRRAIAAPRNDNRAQRRRIRGEKDAANPAAAVRHERPNSAHRGLPQARRHEGDARRRDRDRDE
jgi:hypothetical protein